MEVAVGGGVDAAFVDFRGFGAGDAVYVGVVAGFSAGEEILGGGVEGEGEQDKQRQNGSVSDCGRFHCFEGFLQDADLFKVP